jgi:epoxyqueuosine reductase
MEILNEIRKKCLDAGFDLFGVVRPSRTEFFSIYQDWVNNGFQADMHWIENHVEKRADNRLMLENCQSIIVLGVSYFNRNYSPEEINDPNRALIARYAWGDDYHEVIKNKLKEIGNFINTLHETNYKFKGFVDTAPIAERELATVAGLGWIGKNGNVINHQIGSYFFIASLFTQARIEEHQEKVIGSCGSCQKCLLACPTNALVKEKTVDARKCISYHTIENRGEIPVEIKEKMKNRIYGCDICQEVCPWNRFAKKTRMPELEIMNDRDKLSMKQIVDMTREEYQRFFKDSAVKRAKLEGLKRNVK